MPYENLDMDSITPELARKFLAKQDMENATKSSAGQLDKKQREKAFGETKPMAKGDLYKAMGAEVTPRMWQDKPYAAATAKTAQEGIATPALHFINQLAMNYPRAVAESKGYEYPEAETLPGQILSKAAGIMGAVKSPVTRAIAGGVPAMGAGKGAITGAAKGAAVGALYAPGGEGKDLLQPDKRMLQALLSGGVGGAMGAVAGSVRQSLHSRPEKVNQIREGMQRYWRQNIKEYGNMLKDVQKSSGGEAGVDPASTLEWLKKDLMDKGVVNEMGKKIGKSFSKVTNREYALFKKLEKDVVNLAKNNKVPLQDVLQASRDVKAAGGKFGKTPTAMTKEAEDVRRGILEGVKGQIKSEEFLKGQAKYSQFRERFDLVNKKFDIWASKLETGKGERALDKIFSSGEMRMIGKIIEEETGVKLANEKILSAMSNPQFIEAAKIAGVTASLIYFTNRLSKQFSDTPSGGGESRTD